MALKPPETPLVLRTSLENISLDMPRHTARLVNSELETLYSMHFRTFPEWTWNDVHDLDRDAFVELEQIIQGVEDPNLIASFPQGWREQYKQVA